MGWASPVSPRPSGKASARVIRLGRRRLPEWSHEFASARVIRLGRVLGALLLIPALGACQRGPDEPGKGRPSAEAALASLAAGLSRLDLADAPVDLAAPVPAPTASPPTGAGSAAGPATGSATGSPPETAPATESPPGTATATESPPGTTPATGSPPPTAPATGSVARPAAATGPSPGASRPATDPATADLAAAVEAMDGIAPEVTVGSPTYPPDIDVATSTLHVRWAFPAGDWAYDVPVTLRFRDGQWRADWSASLLHPRLDGTHRLVHLRLPAKRAGIVGSDGQLLIDEVTVVKVGIDKTFVDAGQWETSAKALATRLGLDPAAFAQRVLDSGPKAFVDAQTFRQDEVPDILDIAGARGVEDTAWLGPSPGFLTEVVGTVHEATAEDIAASSGRLAQGDLVGAGGLERTFDQQLAGVPGDQVYVAPRGDDYGAATVDTILFETAPVAGTPLQTSFEVATQLKAQQALAAVGQPAAAAIIRPSDGAILAAAVSPQTSGRPDATLNHFPPGSTFKVVTALALLRHGLTPDSPVDCSPVATVGGLAVRNYTGFPAGYLGSISLQTAFAQSCNTAFVNQAGLLGDHDLLNAAASLGAGVDYDAGGLLYGTVPIPDSEAMTGQMTIGQGGVLMSPVALGAVAASVAAGHTVVPWMVASLKPQPSGAPLTGDEAAALQRLMAYAVTNGLAANLQGTALGAKSGTAEYGQGNPLPTHAWMIAYTGADRAVAVWLQDGGGSATAGPVVLALLS